MDLQGAWRTAEGRPQRTSYAVLLRRGLCFAAGATPQPRRPLRLDHPHLLRRPARCARERAARMLRPLALAAAAAAVALAGCGGGKEGHAANPPAQPYSKRSTAPGAVARVTPADYRRPIATYKRYVRRQLGTLLGEVATLRAAIARHDLAGARAAWLKADARYESIGAAYGAFGDLDAAVNGPSRRPARRDPLAGLHGPSSHRARALAAALHARRRRARAASGPRDVARLRATVARHDDRPAGVLAARARDPRGRHSICSSPGRRARGAGPRSSRCAPRSAARGSSWPRCGR